MSDRVPGKRPKPRILEISLPDCTVFLRTDELLRLLCLDPDLYAEALQRGKGVLRVQGRQGSVRAKLRCAAGSRKARHNKTTGVVTPLKKGGAK
jgi:hypothetical protein